MKRRSRPTLLPIEDPVTKLRAPARVWRAVFVALGVPGFDDLPRDRAVLRAAIETVQRDPREAVA